MTREGLPRVAGCPALLPGDDWEAVAARFRWPCPARYNIAEAACDAWARHDPECLGCHPDVALAAVVGLPDPIRTELVTAFVVPRAGARLGDIEAALIGRVRERLSAHEYPREIHFIGEMPLTTTGKIIRRILRDRVS